MCFKSQLSLGLSVPPTEKSISIESVCWLKNSASGMCWCLLAQNREVSLRYDVSTTAVPSEVLFLCSCRIPKLFWKATRRCCIMHWSQKPGRPHSRSWREEGLVKTFSLNIGEELESNGYVGTTMEWMNGFWNMITLQLYVVREARGKSAWLSV